MFTTADFTAYPATLPRLDSVALDENLRQRILRLIHEACSPLLRLEGQKICEIDATVTNGHVVLRGNVECSSLQRLAESVARTIPEVKSVRSEIQVGETYAAAYENCFKIERGAYEQMESNKITDRTSVFDESTRQMVRVALSTDPS